MVIPLIVPIFDALLPIRTPIDTSLHLMCPVASFLGSKTVSRVTNYLILVLKPLSALLMSPFMSLHLLVNLYVFSHSTPPSPLPCFPFPNQLSPSPPLTSSRSSLTLPSHLLPLLLLSLQLLHPLAPPLCTRRPPVWLQDFITNCPIALPSCTSYFTPLDTSSHTPTPFPYITTSHFSPHYLSFQGHVSTLHKPSSYSQAASPLSGVLPYPRSFKLLKTTIPRISVICLLENGSLVVGGYSKQS